MKIALAIFCCNRPDHLRRLLGSVLPAQGLEPEDVYYFCDGCPSSASRNDWLATQELVRRSVETYGGKAVFAEKNQGLAQSIYLGVTRVLQSYEGVIVLEDDLVVHRQFIQFHVRALSLYRDQSKVLQISGFSFKIGSANSLACYFLPSVSTWGWSTWKRAWREFSMEKMQEKQSSGLTWLEKYAFDYWGAYAYSEMLKSRLLGRNSSWGVLWNWHVFKKRGAVLYPPKSLVFNAGFDGSGTHCRNNTCTDWQMTCAEMRSVAGVDDFRLPEANKFTCGQVNRHADALIKMRMRSGKSVRAKLDHCYQRIRFRLVRLLLSPLYHYYQ